MRRDRPVFSEGLALRPLLGLAGRFPLGGRDLAHRSIESLGLSFRAELGRHLNEALRLLGVVVRCVRGLCHGGILTQGADHFSCVAGLSGSTGLPVMIRYAAGVS